MIRYVAKSKSKSRYFIAKLYAQESGGGVKMPLLWGDRVEVLDNTTNRWHVKVRGVKGFMYKSHLTTKPLLEFYFIDVGQGDGLLIKTPDGRHILVDGGWPRKSQPLGKNAADFVDWKFFKEYDESTIELDAMICSHNDQDHYGGLWDLVNDDPKVKAELDTGDIRIENFYHAGLSWWKINGDRSLGTFTTKPGESQEYWDLLLEDRASLEAALNPPQGQPELQGEWKKFLAELVNAQRKDGSPTPITRLSDKTGFLPGYGANEEVSIKILAPIEDSINGKPVIPRFSANNSINTNGNSVLFRVDYGDSRFLITGDLNWDSQQFLLKHYQNDLHELGCDVTKACHHGSGDVSISFLDAIKPCCTVISSGDSEGHDHPKPNIIAASGITGYRQTKDDKLLTPLVYSTELSRSLAPGKIYEMEKLKADRTVEETYDFDALFDYRIKYKVTFAGDRNPQHESGFIRSKRVIDKATYGLVNVRTDGEDIMCAVLNEKKFKWNISAFKSRFAGD